MCAFKCVHVQLQLRVLKEEHFLAQTEYLHTCICSAQIRAYIISVVLVRAHAHMIHGHMLTYMHTLRPQTGSRIRVIHCGGADSASSAAGCLWWREFLAHATTCPGRFAIGSKSLEHLCFGVFCTCVCTCTYVVYCTLVCVCIHTHMHGRLHLGVCGNARAARCAHALVLRLRRHAAMCRPYTKVNTQCLCSCRINVLLMSAGMQLAHIAWGGQ